MKAHCSAHMSTLSVNKALSSESQRNTALVWDSRSTMCTNAHDTDSNSEPTPLHQPSFWQCKWVKILVKFKNTEAWLPWLSLNNPWRYVDLSLRLFLRCDLVVGWREAI